MTKTIDNFQLSIPKYIYCSLKDKINLAPTHPDEQPIPKSLEKIMNLKNNVTTELKKVKNKARVISNSNSTPNIKLQRPKVKKTVKRLNTEKAPANFSRLPGESDNAFLGRVNLTVREYLKEAEFENKFGVNVERDRDTGEVIGVEKRPKDELEELIKKAKKGKKKKKKQSNETGEPRLTKTQKRSKKLSEKKQKKELAKIDEFDKFSDNVKFGETVHAPPNLTAPRKVSKTNLAPRVSIF